MGWFIWYFYLKVGICILLCRMSMRPRHVMDFKLLKHQRKMLSVNQQQRPRWTNNSNNLKKGFLLSVEQIPLLEQSHNLLIFIFFSSIFSYNYKHPTNNPNNIPIKLSFLLYKMQYENTFLFVSLIKVFFLI